MKDTRLGVVKWSKFFYFFQHVSTGNCFRVLFTPGPNGLHHRDATRTIERMLVATDLIKRYGPLTAVDDVSLEIRKGEAFGLLGPNGAGKSTTISMLVGLSRPDQGSVHLDGELVTQNAASVKKHIGFVPQELAVIEEVSSLANLQFFGGLYNLEGAELDKRIDHALEVSGLERRSKDAVKTFSGGMKRRLNLAIALLHRPKLLVLDEPTVGVDPQSRNAIFDSLVTLQQEGMTILYTTHYMEEVEKLCQRAAIMDAGKVLALDELSKLKGILPGSKLALATKAEHQADLHQALKDAGLETTTVGNDGLQLESCDLASDLALVVGVAKARHIPLTSLESKSATLEQVFLHLTGKSLRD